MVFLSALLLSLSPTFPAHAEPVPGSSWETPAEDRPDTSDPSGGDKGDFFEGLRDGAFDKICRHIKLEQRPTFDLTDWVGVGVGAGRRVVRLRDDRLALADKATLDLQGNYKTDMVELAGRLSFVIDVGASLVGESLLVRPLEDTTSCKAAKELIDVRSYKTVLPFRSRRFQAMDVGEVWKIPFRFEMHVRPGIGWSQGDAGFVFAMGWAKQAASNLTLHRLAEDQLRVRLRLDHATVKDRSGTLAWSYTGDLWTVSAANFALEFLSEKLADEVRDVLIARLQILNVARNGASPFVEFVLDPRDAGQMEKLERFMHGEIEVLEELSRAIVHFKDSPDTYDTREGFAEMVDEMAEALAADPTLAGTNLYERRNRGWRFILPILMDHRSDTAFNDERILLIDDAGTEYQAYIAEDTNDTRFLDMPIVGALQKKIDQDQFQIFTYANKDGETGSPAAVFVHQRGFVRAGTTEGWNLYAEANDITQYIGADGAGINPDTMIPVPPTLPEPVYERRRVTLGRDRGETRTVVVGPSYKRGVSALTLVLNQKAIQDILNTPLHDIAAAYANTLTGERREAYDYIRANGTIAEDGEVDYRSRAQTWNHPKRGAVREHRDDAFVAEELEGLLEGVLRARNAATPNAQAEAVARLVAGEDTGDLAYRATMKVLVQLVDPADVYGEFLVVAQKKKAEEGGERGVNARYLLNPGLRDEESLRGYSHARQLFRTPAPYSD